MRIFFLCFFVFAAAVGAREVAADEAKPEAESFKETVVVKKRHTVVKANTLWDMAVFYYEDPWKWPVIYEANKDRIKNPHWIYPGQQFIIPGLEGMVTVVKELSSPPPPAPASEPEEPQEEAVLYEANKGGIVLPDDLSVEMPRGMAGQQPSMYRMKMQRDWEADGKVVEFRGRESMAAEGDVVSVKIGSGNKVLKRQRYTVYRRAAASEADVDKKAKYFQKVGLVEIVKKVAEKEYRARILKSGGSVQVGDLIKLER